jgi:hypothetical protein
MVAVPEAPLLNCRTIPSCGAVKENSLAPAAPIELTPAPLLMMKPANPASVIEESVNGPAVVAPTLAEIDVPLTVIVTA